MDTSNETSNKRNSHTKGHNVSGVVRQTLYRRINELPDTKARTDYHAKAAALAESVRAARMAGRGNTR